MITKSIFLKRQQISAKILANVHNKVFIQRRADQ